MVIINIVRFSVKCERVIAARRVNGNRLAKVTRFDYFLLGTDSNVFMGGPPPPRNEKQHC
jgi:hypothetical protein